MPKFKGLSFGGSYIRAEKSLIEQMLAPVNYGNLIIDEGKISKKLKAAVQARWELKEFGGGHDFLSAIIYHAVDSLEDKTRKTCEYCVVLPYCNRIPSSEGLQGASDFEKALGIAIIEYEADYGEIVCKRPGKDKLRVGGVEGDLLEIHGWRVNNFEIYIKAMEHANYFILLTDGVGVSEDFQKYVENQILQRLPDEEKELAESLGSRLAKMIKKEQTNKAELLL